MSVKVIRKGSGPALIKPSVARVLPWGKLALMLLGVVFAILVAHPAFAQAAPIAVPTPGAGDAADRALKDLGGGNAPMALSLQILIVMGLLTILPGILLMMTSFTRIIIVLGAACGRRWACTRLRRPTRCWSAWPSSCHVLRDGARSMERDLRRSLRSSRMRKARSSSTRRLDQGRGDTPLARLHDSSRPARRTSRMFA